MPFSGKWANAGMVRGGGADIAWCVYDAQYFGTAQRRRRVFFVVDFRGERAGKILFVPKSLRGYFKAGQTEEPPPAATDESGTGGKAGEMGKYREPVLDRVFLQRRETAVEKIFRL